jgi:hypothetical protein
VANGFGVEERGGGAPAPAHAAAVAALEELEDQT